MRLPEANNRSRNVSVTTGQNKSALPSVSPRKERVWFQKDATSFREAVFKALQITACLALVASNITICTLLKGIFFFF